MGWKRPAGALAVILALVAAVWWLRGNPETEADDAAANAETPAVDPSALPPGGNAVESVAPTRVAGTVLDADTGTSIAGATVVASATLGNLAMLTVPGESGRPALARADADGAWSLEGIEPGRIVLSASAPGHLPVTHTVRVRPGEAIADIELRLSAGGQPLTGVVSDVGGGPIEGALVRAHRGGGGATWSAAGVSDEEGNYSVVLPAGLYHLEVWHLDYASEQVRGVRVSDAPRTKDIELLPGSTISGRVLQRGSGEPVAGATVGFGMKQRRGRGFSTGSAEPGQLAVSDAAGRFTLRRLAAAEYDLRARASGLASLASTAVGLGIGEARSDVVLFVDPAFDVRGRVVDKAKPEDGIEGVTVVATVISRFSSGMITSAPTAEDGSFVLEGLTPTTYTVFTQGPGVLAVMDSVEVVDADVEDAVLEVERATAISGRVEPPGVAHVSLKLRESTGGFEVMMQGMRLQQARTESDAEGRFTMESGATGDYLLVATRDDGAHGEVEVSISETGADDLVVELHERATIAGVVVDTTGAPVSEVEISYRSTGADGSRRLRHSRGSGRTITDPEGRFEIVGVEPGSYWVVARRSDVVAKIEGDDPGVRVEVVDTEAVDDVRVVVEFATGRIAGVVVDDADVPQPDAWVSIYAQEGTSLDRRQPEVSDLDGRFSFEHLPEGTYGISVRTARGDAAAKVEGVTVGSDVTAVLEAFGTVTGTVTAGGRAVSQWSLSGGMFSSRSFASSDGRFTLERVKPGEQRLVVTAKEGSAQKAIEVVSGETTDVAIELAQWGGVTGRAVDADSKPVEGLKVFARSSGGDRDEARRFAAIFGAEEGEIVTDSDGRFTVDGLGEGRGSVELSKEGLFSPSSDVGSAHFYVEAAKTVDVGDIRVLEDDTVDKDKRGDLGMRVQVAAEAPEDDEKQLYPTEPIEAPQQPSALWVWRVDEGSTAEAAGVRRGDRVVAFDGVTASEVGPSTLGTKMSRTRIEAGRTYTVTLANAKGEREVSITAGAASR